MKNLITIIGTLLIFTGCILNDNNSSNVIKFNQEINPGHYTSNTHPGYFWSLNLQEDKSYFVQVFWYSNQCELKGTDSTGFIRCQYENDRIVSDWEEIQPFFEKKTSIKNVRDTKFEYYNYDLFVKIFWNTDPITLKKSSGVPSVEWVEFVKSN